MLVVGPMVVVDGDGAWIGGQGASDVGEGVVGGVVVVGGAGDVGVGAEGEAPGDVADAETVMASFWPDWQCRP